MYKFYQSWIYLWLSPASPVYTWYIDEAVFALLVPVGGLAAPPPVILALYLNANAGENHCHTPEWRKMSKRSNKIIRGLEGKICPRSRRLIRIDLQRCLWRKYVPMLSPSVLYNNSLFSGERGIFSSVPC